MRKVRVTYEALKNILSTDSRVIKGKILNGIPSESKILELVNHPGIETFDIYFIDNSCTEESITIDSTEDNQ